ncbi:hypothetical protein ACLMJK_006837 [Lecanora helva]
MKAAFTTLLSATALPLALAQSTNNDFTNTTTSLARRQVVKSLHDNQKCPMPIHINTYSQKGCKGAALIAKDNTVLGHSYDVPGTASIHIDRDLMNNEQIDLSFQPGKKSKLRLRDFEEVVGDEEQRPTATEGNGPTLTKRGQNKHCTYCAHSYAFRLLGLTRTNCRLCPFVVGSR